MHRARKFPTAAIAIAAGTVLTAVACGSTTGHVAKSELDAKVKSQLAATVGQTPDSVTCPDDLPAKVGATERCTLTASGTTYGLTLTVTAVHGTSTVDFDIKVDQTPVGGAPSSPAPSASATDQTPSTSAST